MITRFVDARGTEWEVWEVGARVTLADRAPRRESSRRDASAPWLCFESATQRRRLDRYPRQWHALPAHGLAALCASAAPVQPVVPDRSWAVDWQWAELE